jgi:hypothetical protein
MISAAEWWIPEDMQGRGGAPVAVAPDADR